MEPGALELAVGETKEVRVWAFPTKDKEYKVPGEGMGERVHHR